MKKVTILKCEKQTKFNKTLHTAGKLYTLRDSRDGKTKMILTDIGEIQIQHAYTTTIKNAFDLVDVTDVFVKNHKGAIAVAKDLECVNNTTWKEW